VVVRAFPVKGSDDTSSIPWMLNSGPETAGSRESASSVRRAASESSEAAHDVARRLSERPLTPTAQVRHADSLEAVENPGTPSKVVTNVLVRALPGRKLTL
jgi:hypothetical protein